MQAIAIDRLEELSTCFLWPALLHSVWIGLVTASVSAFILQASARLSHHARHAILASAIAVVITGPAIATLLQQALAARTLAENASGWDVMAGKVHAGDDVGAHAARRDAVPRSDRSRSGSHLAEFTAAWLATAATIAARARPFVVSAWLCGVAIFAGFLALGARTVNRLRREAGAASQTIHEKADAMARRLGLRGAAGARAPAGRRAVSVRTVSSRDLSARWLGRLVPRRFARRHPGTRTCTRSAARSLRQPGSAPRRSAAFLSPGRPLALAIAASAARVLCRRIGSKFDRRPAGPGRGPRIGRPSPSLLADDARLRQFARRPFHFPSSSYSGVARHEAPKTQTPSLALRRAAHRGPLRPPRGIRGPCATTSCRYREILSARRCSCAAFR